MFPAQRGSLSPQPPHFVPQRRGYQVGRRGVSSRGQVLNGPGHDGARRGRNEQGRLTHVNHFLSNQILPLVVIYYTYSSTSTDSSMGFITSTDSSKGFYLPYDSVLMVRTCFLQHLTRFCSSFGRCFKIPNYGRSAIGAERSLLIPSTRYCIRRAMITHTLGCASNLLFSAMGAVKNTERWVWCLPPL